MWLCVEAGAEQRQHGHLLDLVCVGCCKETKEKLLHLQETPEIVIYRPGYNSNNLCGESGFADNSTVITQKND